MLLLCDTWKRIMRIDYFYQLVLYSSFRLVNEMLVPKLSSLVDNPHHMLLINNEKYIYFVLFTKFPPF